MVNVNRINEPCSWSQYQTISKHECSRRWSKDTSYRWSKHFYLLKQECFGKRKILFSLVATNLLWIFVVHRRTVVDSVHLNSFYRVECSVRMDRRTIICMIERGKSSRVTRCNLPHCRASSAGFRASTVAEAPRRAPCKVYKLQTTALHASLLIVLSVDSSRAEQSESQWTCQRIEHIDRRYHREHMS